MAESFQPGLHELGVVVKAHGIRGGLLVEVDDPEIPSDQLKMVYLRTSEMQWAPFRVTEIQPHFDRKRNLFFVLLEGVNSRTHAESLKGFTVMSDLERKPEIDQASIIGYRVFRDDGTMIGVLSDILETPAHDVFVIQSDQRQILIPFVDEFVKNVCDDTETITVRNTDDLENLE